MELVSTGWDYSNLTAMAKKAGGPDKLLSQIENVGYDSGYADGMGLGMLVSAGAAAIIFVAAKFKDRLSKQAKSSAAHLEDERLKAKDDIQTNEIEAVVTPQEL